MYRLANYVFGTEIESNSDNENIDLNECIEQDIDDDWILIDVPSKRVKQNNAIEANGGKDLPSNDINYETTSKRVPQSLNTSYAQQLVESNEDSYYPDSINAREALEESWLFDPPPCFNSLSHQVMIDESPLENLLIEHPSISVFGPSLPPIDYRSSHSSRLLPINMSSNQSAQGSARPQSRRQMRQLRRQQQQQLIVQNRNDNQMNINSHLRSVVSDEFSVLNEMQTNEVSDIKKLLTKSSMDRQNKILVQRNRPQNRRSKMAVRPNGIYNNRNKC